MSSSDSDLSSLEDVYDEDERVSTRKGKNQRYIEDDEEDEENDIEDDNGDDDELSDDEEDEDEEDVEEYENDDEGLPLSSDDEAIQNIDDGDDDIAEQEPEKKKPKLKLKVTAAKGIDDEILSDSVGQDDDDDAGYSDSDDASTPKPRGQKTKQKTKQITKSKKANPPEPPKVKRPVGRPRKTPVDSAPDYNDYDVLSDSEDIIPTPSLDDEGLSDDDEQNYYKPADVTKMTERQRSKLLDGESKSISSTSSLNPTKFLALSNNISKRRVLTEEENQLKKAEIARKRKNFIERKLEEEKQDTINKLLKRRAAKVSAASLKEDEEQSGSLDKPRRPQLQHPALFSWVSKKDSLQLRVPEPLSGGIVSKSK